MKLLKLKIENIRGIKDLSLEPNGENIVILGPNGAGKSAVVDAVEFLLTGSISRLSGQGTGGLTVKKYGRHVDAKPGESSVTAVLEIPGCSKPVEIRRCIENTSKLVFPPEFEADLHSIRESAEKGQLVLSRREILKYIQSESGKRADEIMALLNLKELENVRRTFVKVVNQAKQATSTSESGIKTAEQAAAATIRIPTYDESQILNKGNEFRSLLGLASVSKLSSVSIIQDVSLNKAEKAVPRVDSDGFAKDVEALLLLLSNDNQRKIEQDLAALRDTVSKINEDLNLAREVKCQRLLELGISLIDDNGSCPLCLTNWQPDQLKKMLQVRLTHAEQAHKLQTEVDNKTNDLRNALDKCQVLVDKILQALKEASIDKHIDAFSGWRLNLLSARKLLDQPLEGCDRLVPEDIRQLCAPDNIASRLSDTSTIMSGQYPKISEEDKAHQTIIRLSENLKAREKALEQHQADAMILRRAEVLKDVFETTRSDILDALYDKIKTRFTELYKQVHSVDESSFDAELKLDGGKLDFTVDFYNRGKVHPLALHSEGHQDTMGLCLYLALTEYLSGQAIKVTVLDDVVMSVDAEHRRDVCSMLSQMFPDRQFLITTHDRTWARQLQTEGTVQRKNCYEFGRWTLETGPIVNIESDPWTKIEDALACGDVPTAAFELRRASEEFFLTLGESLQAQVSCKPNGDWSFAELLNASVAKYRKLLKEAKATANSWNQQDVCDEIAVRETVVKQISQRARIEDWAVNPNVHYNSWANFTATDFQPVAEAFQDLFGIFVCPDCESIISVKTEGLTPSILSCKCGQVSFNLQKKRS